MDNCLLSRWLCIQRKKCEEVRTHVANAGIESTVFNDDNIEALYKAFEEPQNHVLCHFLKCVVDRIAFYFTLYITVSNLSL